MQRLEVSGAVRPIYGSLGAKRLIFKPTLLKCIPFEGANRDGTQAVKTNTGTESFTVF